MYDNGSLVLTAQEQAEKVALVGMKETIVSLGTDGLLFRSNKSWGTSHSVNYKHRSFSFSELQLQICILTLMSWQVYRPLREFQYSVTFSWLIFGSFRGCLALSIFIRFLVILVPQIIDKTDRTGDSTVSFL